MQITFKLYRRRDGSLMLYVNRSNKVSVALSPEKGYAPYGRDTTPGMRNAMDAALAVFRHYSEPFTGDLARHTENPPVQCGPYTLALTDVANIGGMAVGGDGAYVIRDHRILRCGVAYDEPTLAEEPTP
jgi:hypothetical protein